MSGQTKYDNRAQRDLPTTEYGTQVRDDECPLREDGEPE